MLSAAKLKEHYAFTEEDAARLARLREFMEPAKERVAEEFYRFIAATPEIASFVEGQPVDEHATLGGQLGQQARRGFAAAVEEDALAG